MSNLDGLYRKDGDVYKARYEENIFDYKVNSDGKLVKKDWITKFFSSGKSMSEVTYRNLLEKQIVDRTKKRTPQAVRMQNAMGRASNDNPLTRTASSSPQPSPAVLPARTEDEKNIFIQRFAPHNNQSEMEFYADPHMVLFMINNDDNSIKVKYHDDPNKIGDTKELILFYNRDNETLNSKNPEVTFNTRGKSVSDCWCDIRQWVRSQVKK